jgi:hypothetical protein
MVAIATGANKWSIRSKAVGRGSAVFLPADFSSLAEVRRLREVNCIPPAILTVIETNMMLALSRSGQVDC